MDTIKWQTRVVYGYLGAAQSPWVRAWTAHLHSLYAVRPLRDTKAPLQIAACDTI